MEWDNNGTWRPAHLGVLWVLEALQDLKNGDDAVGIEVDDEVGAAGRPWRISRLERSVMVSTVLRLTTAAGSWEKDALKSLRARRDGRRERRAGRTEEQASEETAREKWRSFGANGINVKMRR